MLKDFKSKNILEKVTSVIGFIIAILIIVLAIIDIFNIIENDVYMLLLGILMIIQTINTWRKDKATSYFSLFVGLYILLIYCVTFIK